jgi:hypothetical protein
MNNERQLNAEIKGKEGHSYEALSCSVYGERSLL